MSDKRLKNTNLSFYQQELVRKLFEKVMDKESKYSFFFYIEISLI